MGIFMSDKIWTKSLMELLNHGIEHLDRGNNFDLRIAMISIDNAVELAMKTYFAKNKRVLSIARKDFKTTGMVPFPKLLDTFTNFAPDKISKEELDAIEYLHSYRNNLYHEGNGFTVEVQMVEEYAKIAGNLISALFEKKKIKKKLKSPDKYYKLAAEFLEKSEGFEEKIINFALSHSFDEYLKKIGSEGSFDDVEMFNYLINHNYWKEIDSDKYIFVYKTRERFYSEENIPDLKEIEKAQEYLTYFVKIEGDYSN